MSHRCPHCRQKISFSVSVSVTDLNDINADIRNKEIFKLKKKFPTMSVRAIAEIVGCSFATVSRVLKEAAE